jgi:predicted small secreted protein
VPLTAADRRAAVRRLLGPAMLVILALVVTGCAPAAGSSWSWTTQRTVAGSGGLDGIACPTATGCVALAGNAESVRLDGSTWSAPIPVEQVRDSVAPFALTCVRTTWCATIDGLGRVLTYDGQRWSRPVQVDSASAGITDISCASPEFCAVVDSNGDAAMYDGVHWSKPAPVADSSGLVAVSCPASGVCFAIDVQSDEVFRYADGRWSISADLNVSTPQGGSEPNTLGAISCASAHFCVALDDFGEAFTYDGKWSTGAHTFDTIADGEEALSCTAPLTCMVVDDNNNAVVDENGAWAAPHHLDARGTMLLDVSCAPRARCVAVDGKGAYFVGHSSSRS